MAFEDVHGPREGGPREVRLERLDFSTYKSYTFSFISPHREFLI